MSEAIEAFVIRYGHASSFPVSPSSADDFSLLVCNERLRMDAIIQDWQQRLDKGDRGDGGKAIPTSWHGQVRYSLVVLIACALQIAL